MSKMKMSSTCYGVKGVVHKLHHHFFEIFDPSLRLLIPFTKYAYGVMSPFGRSALPLVDDVIYERPLRYN